MIRRIDHVIAVVADVDEVRARLVDIDCPQVWDGRSGEHRDTLFSLGPTRLELLSPGAFDGWPALADLAAHTDRSPGIRVAALDPGDLDDTLRELAGAGIQATAPQPGSLLALDAAPGAAPIARWRNSYVDGLRGLLPGLPTFLCEIANPIPDATDVPLRFVELRVGVPDPAQVAARYAQVLGVGPMPDEGGTSLVVPIPWTPIRLVRGEGLQVVVAPQRSVLSLPDLQQHIPGLVWADPPSSP
jgi:catechol 2,3-dioxygenase-like lactoylglutathione lyase family enzyme